mgnify:CR=1 FL=1
MHNILLLGCGTQGLALVKCLKKAGHTACAITDHNGCQAFPHVFNTVCGYNKGKEEQDKFKKNKGLELLKNDSPELFNDKNLKIKIRPEEIHRYNSPWNIAAGISPAQCAGRCSRQ